jgi:hypothetical protein
MPSCSILLKLWFCFCGVFCFFLLRGRRPRTNQIFSSWGSGGHQRSRHPDDDNDACKKATVSTTPDLLPFILFFFIFSFSLSDNTVATVIHVSFFSMLGVVTRIYVGFVDSLAISRCRSAVLGLAGSCSGPRAVSALVSPLKSVAARLEIEGIRP